MHISIYRCIKSQKSSHKFIQVSFMCVQVNVARSHGLLSWSSRCGTSILPVWKAKHPLITMCTSVRTEIHSCKLMHIYISCIPIQTHSHQSRTTHITHKTYIYTHHTHTHHTNTHMCTQLSTSYRDDSQCPGRAVCVIHGHYFNILGPTDMSSFLVSLILYLTMKSASPGDSRLLEAEPRQCLAYGSHMMLR